MKKILIMPLFLLLAGCYSISRFQEANVVSIHEQMLNDNEIRFITFDEMLYRLMILEMDSLHVKGVGKRRPIQGRARDWTDFKGSVPIKNIDILTFEDSNFGRSMLIDALIITTIVKAARAKEGPSNPSLELVYPPTGGSSCPFIYSWTGNGYQLEGEAFGIALGKARETTTTTVLNRLRDDRGKLRLKITNERPETHFINYICLNAVEVEPQAVVIADNRQNLWPVFISKPPFYATDRTGHSELHQINKSDGLYWESDLNQASAANQFEDALELTFDRPPGAQEGSLIIRAINTHFANMAFDRVFEFLGDQALSFMQAMDNDPQVIRLLQQWTDESSLSVSIWNGKNWQHVDILYPEANVIPFTRLVRLNIPPDTGEKIRLRLSSLAALWKIDAVTIDWTPVTMLQKKEIPLISMSGRYNNHQSGLIRSMDDHYAVLLPAQKIELLYKIHEPDDGKELRYALDVGGYLYEWLPRSTGDSLFAGLSTFSADRIGMVKFLLRHKSLLLPPLYSEWHGRMKE